MISHQQLTDDLRGEFRGKFHVDLATRTLYATDAGPFHILPHAVAKPADEADLVSLVKYAYEQKLPLIPRGAGTGWAGESLGTGIVLDLASPFRTILRVNANSVTVDVGFTLAEVNRALAPHGRRIGPEIRNPETGTIGGMLARNASGSNAILHGTPRSIVRGLRVIWDDGEIAELPHDSTTEAGARLTELRLQTTALIAGNRALIQLTRPQTPFNNAGYELNDVLSAQGLDIAKLLVGSEGTLGLFTQATLATIPLPGGTSAAILGFRGIMEAVRAGLTLHGMPAISACDLVDQRLISLARNAEGTAKVYVPHSIAAVLIVQVEAESNRAAQDHLYSLIERARKTHPAAVLAGPTHTPEARDSILRFRAAAISGVPAPGSRARSVPFIEDVAVPLEEIPRYLSGVTEILRRHDLSASFFLHLLAGHVQARPLIDLNLPADRKRLWPVAEAVYGLAINLGGTVSSQQGTGLTRTPWIEKQYGPLMPVFRELKRIFDPNELLNPGKIIGPDPSRPAWPLRPELPTPEPVTPRRQSLLLWANGPETEASKCHGCGDCRTRAEPVRICPIFHAKGSEAATPRAKANLFRMFHDADPEAFLSDDVRDIAELCVNCKMCLRECPSKVNIPKLAIEAKAAHHAEHGIDREEWFLARLELMATLASNFAFFSNLLLGNEAFRWLLEKLSGIDRHRRLPKFTPRTFLRRAKQRGLTQASHNSEGLRVAYFVDLFANTTDTSIAEATIKVLQHHSIDVFVPPRQKSSGMAALVHGDTDLAAEIAEHHVRMFADLIREGYTVVCSEPSAAMMFLHDTRDLVDSADATLLAENTMELTQFLGMLQQTGRLRTEFPNRVNLQLGHHVPCHIKALGNAAAPQLLAMIPGIQIHTIDRSCSGMAGTYGLQARNQADSFIAGKPMIDALGEAAIEFGSTECSACRMQMQQATGKRTLHPVQYLAWAYGLMPEIEVLLRKPLHPLLSE